MHLDREREKRIDYRVFGLNSRSLLASKDTNIANNCFTLHKFMWNNTSPQSWHNNSLRPKYHYKQSIPKHATSKNTQIIIFQLVMCHNRFLFNENIFINKLNLFSGSSIVLPDLQSPGDHFKREHETFQADKRLISDETADNCKKNYQFCILFTTML